jgi:hypothetical protein
MAVQSSLVNLSIENCVGEVGLKLLSLDLRVVAINWIETLLKVNYKHHSFLSVPVALKADSLVQVQAIHLQKQLSNLNCLS